MAADGRGKKAYHRLARLIHPDLALDDDERSRRHGLMSQLNEAYSAGDQVRLNKLVEDYRDSPELIQGDAVGDNLIRAIRQISQVKTRLRDLAAEKTELELSELFVLSEKVTREMLEGRNLLRQMAERTRTQIKKAERRLGHLIEINGADGGDANTRFGVDISAFRR